ncbi:MAG: site-specific integrase, partial [Pseudomonadota bacterium]
MSSPAGNDFDPWLARFFQYVTHERRLSPRTLEAYRRDLNRFAAWCREQKINQPVAVNSDQIRHYVAQRHRRGIGGRSLQRELSSLRRFFDFLMRERAVEANPASGVRAPKVARRLPGALDADEVTHLLDFAADDPAAAQEMAMMELLYGSGLRLAELVAL